MLLSQSECPETCYFCQYFSTFPPIFSEMLTLRLKGRSYRNSVALWFFQYCGFFFHIAQSIFLLIRRVSSIREWEMFSGTYLAERGP